MMVGVGEHEEKAKRLSKKEKERVLATGAQLGRHRPVHQEVAGWISIQGTCLGFRLAPQ